MDFNFLLFPAPKNFTYLLAHHKDELVFIPKTKKEKAISLCAKVPDISYIPCLFLPSKSSTIYFSPNTFIYFHGNAEDIFVAREIADYIRSNISMNILVVEYPGYSLYDEKKDCSEILEDSLTVYDYIRDTLQILDKNIFVIGRSIGTSPAVYLAANRKPAGLCLMSPFTSIRDVVVNMAGSLFQYFVSDLFNNEEYIKSVTCPILFIHGQKDTLIPYNHTIRLKDNCSSPYHVILPEEMDHNEFDYDYDFIFPLKEFLRSLTDYNSKEICKYIFPNTFFEIPDRMKKIIENHLNLSKCLKC